jgi:hypothetical protein
LGVARAFARRFRFKPAGRGDAGLQACTTGVIWELDWQPDDAIAAWHKRIAFHERIAFRLRASAGPDS